jgi:aminoglycoside phosphotransferase family enzyme
MGEDFVIEMSKIDDTKTLTKLLINSELTKDHAEAFIETTIDILAVLTKERREQLSHLFDKSLAEIMRENIQSLHTWMLGQAPKVPKEDSDNIFELLSKALENEPYFTNIETNGLSVAIDSNCDNLILLNGKPSFIDIMPPMIVWRVVDEYMTVSRLIVDIEALGSKELGDATRAAYAKYQRNLPPIARLAHELRAAGIQWPYRYMLKQDDLAEKFGQYTRAKMAELRALLAQTS